MITKTIEIQEITVDELADKVADKLLNKIKHYLDDLESNESDIYLTRQETASFLKINLTTLWNWTNNGKIKSYGITIEDITTNRK
ncbi:helix-turn-helix domain-containing protein [Thalassobellus suaedae]|uniref:Helix-turn-helix domain-containing protein n=1 Tax=Thalassobellus suaedae TaxID=3074124 RepID=A0ABY9XPF1_9FLAO|nr:helix-turn-helix domain-containing protein [Flavobacteriaceae bacterium HL-DH14]